MHSNLDHFFKKEGCGPIQDRYLSHIENDWSNEIKFKWRKTLPLWLEVGEGWRDEQKAYLKGDCKEDNPLANGC